MTGNIKCLLPCEERSLNLSFYVWPSVGGIERGERS